MKTKGTPADCKFMVSRCFFYLFSEIYLRISFFFIRLTYWRDSFSFRAIWAVLAVFLLVYIVKSNEKRDEKQEEREKNYQSVIEKLTEKLEILHQVQSDLSEIKENLLGKHKQE